MDRNRILAPLALVFVATLSASCLDQFDQTANNANYRQERVNAAKPVAKLTETGDLPAEGAVVVSVDERYTTLCASCHGADGGGDGPAGVALNPKPRNFHDAAWQASADEARIYKVLKEGGVAVGLSAMMPPWGGVLSDEEIKNMVAKIRTFKKG